MTNFKYTLLKISEPGFEFNTSDIKTILHTLEMGVCGICMSFNPVEEYASNIPDNYYELDDLGKIEALLWTACGCEYSFEDNTTGEGWGGLGELVEILAGGSDDQKETY